MIALQLEQLKQQQHIKLQQQQYQQQFQQVHQLQQRPQFLQASTHESSVALELSELPNLIAPKDVTISTDQQTLSPNAYQHELLAQQQHLIQQQEQTQELHHSSEQQQFQEQQQQQQHLSVQTFDMQTTEQSSVVTDSQSQATTAETATVEMPQSCEVAPVIEPAESSSVSNIQEVQPQTQRPPVEAHAQEATNKLESSLIRSDSSQQSPQIQLQLTTQLSPALIAQPQPQPQQIPSSPGQSSTETTMQRVSTTPTGCAVTNSPIVQRAASIASSQSPTLRSPLLSPSVQLAQQQQQQMQYQQQRLQYQPIQLLNLQNPIANNMVIGE